MARAASASDMFFYSSLCGNPFARSSFSSAWLRRNPYDRKDSSAPKPSRHQELLKIHWKINAFSSWSPFLPVTFLSATFAREPKTQTQRDISLPSSFPFHRPFTPSCCRCCQLRSINLNRNVVIPLRLILFRINELCFKPRELLVKMRYNFVRKLCTTN